MAIAIRPQRFPWFDYARYSFSLGVHAGEGAYLSGHTASRYDETAKRIVVTGGMAEQARAAYAKIGAILDAAGLSYSDVVRLVEYVRPEGIERYAEAAMVREDTFGAHLPAVNTVPVRALLRPEAFIEIEATAGPVGPATSFGAGLPMARDSGSLVYLPTIEPLDARGGAVGKGDAAAQARAIFEKARSMLAALGLAFDRVVKVVDYVAPAALGDYERARQAREDFLGPVSPAWTAVLAPRLLHPEALIQCDLIVSRDAPASVDPGCGGYGKLSHSPGVRAGNLLFLSGQGAFDPTSEDDVAAQAADAYARILSVVKAAGGGPEHLVKTIEYVTPAALARYREVGGVRSRMLREPWPASTGLVCQALLRPEMLILVDSLAVLD